ncbi:MAG: hypothetical protein EOP49_30900 [Sphingobacteriales bacterium]|nr:MAG: hypothetical protein EOP49_30900 [Sphingobacteriales bacterium]
MSITKIIAKYERWKIAWQGTDLLGNLWLRIARRFRSPLPQIPFIYPYSPDKLAQREQIWKNLERGLLLEDKGYYLTWDTPFSLMDRYCETLSSRNDRTEWFMGKQPVLGGFCCNTEVMKWWYQSWDEPIGGVSCILGYGESGLLQMRAAGIHLLDTLGPPDVMKKESSELETGTVSWRKGSVEVSLVGFMHYGTMYRLNIGLLKHSEQKRL